MILSLQIADVAIDSSPTWSCHASNSGVKIIWYNDGKEQKLHEKVTVKKIKGKHHYGVYAKIYFQKSLYWLYVAYFLISKVQCSAVWFHICGFSVLQISIQKCDKDGDNRLRVCHSACQSYNLACGASLDCSDQTLFSSEEGEGQCTGASEIRLPWFSRFRSDFYRRDGSTKGALVKYR